MQLRPELSPSPSNSITFCINKISNTYLLWIFRCKLVVVWTRATSGNGLIKDFAEAIHANP